MKDDVLISVIIPIYNCEKYLSRCLDSIINNTYKNLEIICVNDGSADDSHTIVSKYSEMDNRIIGLTKQNGGAASARNAGIKISSGAFVTFVDADDWLHPRFFEIMAEALLNGNADMVICHLQRVNQYFSDFECISDWKELQESFSFDEFWKQKKHDELKKYACGVLYKRDGIMHLFPEKLKVTEDNVFNILNMTSFSKVIIIRYPLYYYFNNNESIMNLYSGMDAYRDLFYACDYLNQWKLENHTKMELVSFLYKRYLFYYYYFPDLRKNKEIKNALKECRDVLSQNDECLKLRHLFCFRLLLAIPFAYVIYKSMKDGIKS